MKILIAEDDLTSSLMLKAILKKWGHEIVSAADGEKAWALLQQTDAPQLAILDWMMPGIDGVTLCRRLKAKDRTTHIYIILLTSKGDQQHIIEGLEAGADDYIIKPYNNEELRARINVGKRILDLQDRLKEREKLQGVLEMAGAVCHEINQPLQAVSGWSEILLMNADKSS
ncbi:MAG: response regulator transcription factor, partial [Desulfobulbaceae bacterium]|nr:response regulator transcription factor [Desulfobulbaceae bacterium]